MGLSIKSTGKAHKTRSNAMPIKNTIENKKALKNIEPISAK